MKTRTTRTSMARAAPPRSACPRRAAPVRRRARCQLAAGNARGPPHSVAGVRAGLLLGETLSQSLTAALLCQSHCRARAALRGTQHATWLAPGLGRKPSSAPVHVICVLHCALRFRRVFTDARQFTKYLRASFPTTLPCGSHPFPEMLSLRVHAAQRAARAPTSSAGAAACAPCAQQAWYGFG